MTQAPDAIAVRRAVPEDASRLAEINVATWRHAYAGIVSTAYLDALDVDAYARRWADRIADPAGETCHLVAVLDTIVASYATGGAYRTQQDAPPGEDTIGWGELFAIYTDPAMQGRGAGGAVHEALLAELTRLGFTVAALWVLRDNVKAIEWYRARGWRQDGTTSMWSGSGEPLPEVRMVHRLPLGAVAR
jgi:GNAT superfamily N-acetyltransferase